MNEITEILRVLSGDGKCVRADLFSALYEDLKRIANGQMKKEQAGHTLQATALVHEAFMKLMSLNSCGWENRHHFFVSATEVMRQILIDHARKRNRQKRGGDLKRCEFNPETISGNLLDTPFDRVVSDEELLRLENALARFETLSPIKARLVKLRFIAGLTVAQSADILGVSRATAERYWSFARAWLHREMENSQNWRKSDECSGDANVTE